MPYQLLEFDDLSVFALLPSNAPASQPLSNQAMSSLPLTSAEQHQLDQLELFPESPPLNQSNAKSLNKLPIYRLFNASRGLANPLTQGSLPLFYCYSDLDSAIDQQRRQTKQFLSASFTGPCCLYYNLAQLRLSGRCWSQCQSIAEDLTANPEGHSDNLSNSAVDAQPEEQSAIQPLNQLPVQTKQELTLETAHQADALSFFYNINKQQKVYAVLNPEALNIEQTDELFEFVWDGQQLSRVNTVKPLMVSQA